jgi:hypothetical protein
MYLKYSIKFEYLGNRPFLPLEHPLRDEKIKHFEGVG